jgi:hypothetical protein
VPLLLLLLLGPLFPIILFLAATLLTSMTGNSLCGAKAYDFSVPSKAVFSSEAIVLKYIYLFN